LRGYKEAVKRCVICIEVRGVHRPGYTVARIPSLYCMNE
jgi:hypothetical protein